MSETKTIPSPVAPLERKEWSKEFSHREVTIKGLPYLFSGKIEVQGDKKNITLWLHIPHWIEGAMKLRNSANAPWALRKEGQIGMIHAIRGAQADLITSGRMTSFTEWIEEGSPYCAPSRREGMGVGSFLLDNLLAIADMNGWTFSAFASTDGRLDDADVTAWLGRRGLEHKKGGFIREPKAVDKSQEIVKILSEEQS